MKRYRIVGDEWAKEHPTGEWVDADDAAEIQRQLDVAKTALDSIARSYPETEEGQALAETAREALKEIPQ